MRVVTPAEESRFSVSFQAFLTIACLLAAVGAITDSPVTVVGAMVLGPEFGPLAAVAVGAVLCRGDLVRRGGFALAVGFPLATEGRYLQAVGSGIQLAVNLVGIAVAAPVVLLLARRPRRGSRKLSAG